MSENTRPMTTEELIAEIKNLKAYAIHERSLAAEKYTQEIHDLKHEVEAMVAENDKLSGLWSKVKDERDAFKADAEQWRAYKSRKDAVIAAGMGRNPLRKEAK